MNKIHIFYISVLLLGTSCVEHDNFKDVSDEGTTGICAAVAEADDGFAGASRMFDPVHGGGFHLVGDMSNDAFTEFRFFAFHNEPTGGMVPYFRDVPIRRDPATTRCSWGDYKYSWPHGGSIDFYGFGGTWPMLLGDHYTDADASAPSRTWNPEVKTVNGRQTVVISGVEVNNPPDGDMIVAKTAGKTYDADHNRDIQMDFYHALCKVEFYAVNRSTKYDVAINGLDLLYLEAKGDYILDGDGTRPGRWDCSPYKTFVKKANTARMDWNVINSEWVDASNNWIDFRYQYPESDIRSRYNYYFPYIRSNDFYGCDWNNPANHWEMTFRYIPALPAGVDEAYYKEDPVLTNDNDALNRRGGPAALYLMPQVIRKWRPDSRYTVDPNENPAQPLIPGTDERKPQCLLLYIRLFDRENTSTEIGGGQIVLPLTPTGAETFTWEPNKSYKYVLTFSDTGAGWTPKGEYPLVPMITNVRISDWSHSDGGNHYQDVNPWEIEQ